MSESLTRQWKVTKQPVRGKGVVVAQNCRAAEVGAEILRKGGNAIDAAVATGMAIGTVEPWMSGIGGVGFMTIWSAKEGRAWTIDYGPISAKKLDPKNYPIVGPGPANPFAWPDILEQRNEVGYHSIAVPGQVAGMAKALERFGTLKWQDVMAPAVAARQARHGTRLVHAGDDRQRRGAPLEVPRVARPTTCPTTAACRPTTGRARRATSSSAISARPTSG